MNDQTDLSVLKAMLDRAAVVYKVDLDLGGQTTLVIGTLGGPNNQGYADFVADFTFTQDGQLLKVGVWE